MANTSSETSGGNVPQFLIPMGHTAAPATAAIGLGCGGLLTSIGIPGEAELLGQSLTGISFLIGKTERSTHITPWPPLLCLGLRPRRRHLAAKRANTNLEMDARESARTVAKIRNKG